MSERVLVTGGAGFIGSHVTPALLDAGHEVVVIDALLPTAHQSPQDGRDPRAEYVVGDLADPDRADQVVAGATAVCHLAAMVGLGVDFADIVAYVRHNDLATATLLGALHRRGFAGRLVLSSSMVVYGEGAYSCAEHGQVRPGPRHARDLERGRWEPTCPRCDRDLRPEAIREDAPLDPRSVYAATKLHQEHLTRAYAREHVGTTLTVLRYHNVYGPGMPADTPYAGVASLFRSALARGECPIVFEDGEQLRDFVHVRDVARANVLAVAAAEPFDGVCNIASGDPRTVGELADALADAFGDDAPRPRVVPRFRLGDVRHVFGSVDAACEHLGIRATITLEEGMRELASSRTARPHELLGLDFGP